MSIQSHQDEGAFGSLLALLVVGAFIALAARLTDGGPVETVILPPDTPTLSARPDPASDAPHALPHLDRVISQR